MAVASPLIASCVGPKSFRSRPRYTDLKEVLAPIRDKSGLPAVAAGVIKQGWLLGLGAVGERKMGGLAVRRVSDGNAVTVADKFHIGSCTKAMTATLAAMLVEQGRIKWNSTLAEIFPERAAKMHTDYRDVTLELLLTHRSGAPANGLYLPLPLVPISLQRLALLDSIVTNPPETQPGSTFGYSNAGYIFAGAMLERVADQTWEDLIQQRLFRPLKMNSAGFGPPCGPLEASQPWGHILNYGKFQPRYGDNPPVLGPAGTVHCSMFDYMKFAGLHASMGAHPRGLLRPASFARLHEPPPGKDYAFGWAVTERSWAQGRTLTHHGSNTMNYFIVWIAPKIDFALAVASNAAGEQVPEVLDSIATELVRRFVTVI